MRAMTASPADVVPHWSDGGLDDVGRELEREASDEPARVAQPDLTHVAVRPVRIEHEAQATHERLDRADYDDDECENVDQQRRIFCGEDQQGFHALAPLTR